MIKIKIVLSICGIIVFTILAISLSTPQTEPMENFKIEISLDKYEYYEGEYINLNIKVKNIGTDLDSIDFLNEEFLSRSISIKNRNRSGSNFRGAESNNFSKTYSKIAAHEEQNYSIVLNNMWGFKGYDTHDESSKNITSRYFPEDKYEVEVTFKYDEGKKRITSNKISFEINNSNANEIIAFEKLKELYKLPYGGFYSESQNQATILKWIDFMDTHVNSVYFENAFKESVYKRKFSFFMYDSTLFNDCVWVIENKPNTKFARTAVNVAADVLKNMTDKNEAILFLEKIKNDHPDTESSEWAEKLLELNEYKK